MKNYCEAVHYLPETYATDDFHAGMDAEILRFMQPWKISPTEYAEALGT